MAILLDTSVAIALLNASPEVVERRRDESDLVFLSVVSRVELVPGLFASGQLDDERAQFLATFLEAVEELPFGSREVEAYQQIVAAKGFPRRLIVDRMIAATAIANDLELATLNTRDFRDIPGLRTEDWSA